METNEAGLDPHVWSNISISDSSLPPRTWTDDAGEEHNLPAMRRLSWREAYEWKAEEAQRLGAFASLLTDLDRCEHGRHEGDDCSSCGGPSKGNPLLDLIGVGASEYDMTSWKRVPSHKLLPRQVGFTMAARPIIVPGPERHVDRSPDGWVGERR